MVDKNILVENKYRSKYLETGLTNVSSVASWSPSVTYLSTRLGFAYLSGPAVQGMFMMGAQLIRSPGGGEGFPDRVREIGACPPPGHLNFRTPRFSHWKSGMCAIYHKGAMG